MTFFWIQTVRQAGYIYFKINRNFFLELDAFLVTACSSELMDSENLARMKLDLVTPRGVQLATLFMQGVDMALFANDACGAPVPFLMCCPWLFFDGKLFHSKLRRAVVAQNLMEMCNHDMPMVLKVTLPTPLSMLIFLLYEILALYSLSDIAHLRECLTAQAT